MECRSGLALSESLERVNLYLCERSTSNRFVTLFLFSLDQNGEGTYVSAGHNPTYLCRSFSHEIEELGAGGLILGAFQLATYQSSPFFMQPGDLLVVYSDGITEAMNPSGEMFGETRLIRVIRDHATQGCTILKEAILKAIQEFTQGRHQTDDMTFLIVQKK
jgi:sigma-B regulation protein RsbU (phosphoserine phosphatase)